MSNQNFKLFDNLTEQFKLFANYAQIVVKTLIEPKNIVIPYDQEMNILHAHFTIAQCSGFIEQLGDNELKQTILGDQSLIQHLISTNEGSNAEALIKAEGQATDAMVDIKGAYNELECIFYDLYRFIRLLDIEADGQESKFKFFNGKLEAIFILYNSIPDYSGNPYEEQEKFISDNKEKIALALFK